MQGCSLQRCTIKATNRIMEKELKRINLDHLEMDYFDDMAEQGILGCEVVNITENNVYLLVPDGKQSKFLLQADKNEFKYYDDLQIGDFVPVLHFIGSDDYGNPMDSYSHIEAVRKRLELSCSELEKFISDFDRQKAEDFSFDKAQAKRFNIKYLSSSDGYEYEYQCYAPDSDSAEFNFLCDPVHTKSRILSVNEILDN